MSRVLTAVFYLLAMPATLCGQQAALAPPSQDAALVKLAKQIEPDLVGEANRLQQYIDFFQSKLGNDSRLFAFNVKAVAGEKNEVNLIGHVEFPHTRKGLIGFLEILGFKVTDEQLLTLPDKNLGQKAYGFVNTTHTLSYDSPRKSRDVVTDCLLGEPLYLLREEGDYLLVHSGEGYLGYVSASDVYRVDAKAFARYPADQCVRVLTEFTLDNGLTLPAGAILKQLPSDEQQVHCELPTGNTIQLPSKVCEPVVAPAAAIERAIKSARELLGTPYHWGGKTSAGIDCSGLVQIAFATTGVQLPRDSNQQFLLGQLVATRWERSRLRRGDTLYFLGTNGRIRHTALYIGDDRYLQAETPVVNIRSLNPQHEDYDARRAANFAFGKRLWQ